MEPHNMTELDAMRWIQNQPGLTMRVGKNKHITLTNGVNVYAEGIGMLGAVIRMQQILKQMRDNEA